MKPMKAMKRDQSKATRKLYVSFEIPSSWWSRARGRPLRIAVVHGRARAGDHHQANGKPNIVIEEFRLFMVARARATIIKLKDLEFDGGRARAGDH